MASDRLQLRPFITLKATLLDLIRAARIAADVASFAQMCQDFLAYRFLRLAPSATSGRARTVRLRGDVALTYRLNRGDLVALRETWMYRSYRLPFAAHPRVAIDLGANIGLTSVWLARRYALTRLVSVEPLPSNVALLRKNLAQNGVEAIVVEAAVGPRAGRVRFTPAVSFTEGRVVGPAGKDADGSKLVEMVTMPQLLDLLPETEVDLLKLDIEGGEGELLSDEPSWLDRIRAIIVEFHPNLVDHRPLVRTIEAHGLAYLPAGSVFRDSMDAFVRWDGHGREG